MLFSPSLLDPELAAHHICRRAVPQDISRSRTLWERNRKLFDSETWNALPSLLKDLLMAELISLVIVESVRGKWPRMLGGIAFVDPKYVDEARASSLSLHNFIFAAALRGKNPFLAPKQVAVENARGTLNLMNFFGNFGEINLSNPELNNFYAVSNEGYRFFHFGYNFKVMWFEVIETHHATELQAQGMHIDRQLLLPEGESATLLRLTVEDALAHPYSRFCGLFFPPKPRFRFSSGEQMLLEHALLEYSDDEARSRLNLSADAVKKRWRSIYRKVDMAAPELLSGTESGTARRRTLLHHLKQHLEELRPYHEMLERNEKNKARQYPSRPQL